MKPQDIVVALKLCVLGDFGSYASLGKSLGMSASEVHAAVRRLGEAGLVDPESRLIHRNELRNFLVHGAPYAFPAKAKEVTRGMPTAWAAPVMEGKVVNADQIPVWPDPEGKTKGVSVDPLYRSVVKAASADAALYELLALLDVLRLGRARVRNIAEALLEEKLTKHA